MRAEESHHQTRYEDSRAVVRLTGEISDDTVIRLADEIDLAIDYYCYRHVLIQIASPGGSFHALQFYLNRLRHWRSIDGLILGTVAMTTAASAGAVILSLGTIGHRRAYPAARLLYHGSRIVTGNGQVWTEELLNAHREALAEADALLFSEMAAHSFRGHDHSNPLRVHLPRRGGAADAGGKAADIGTADELAELYRTIAATDRFITPQEAAALGLIDSIEA
jgi:ATP-dependent protease ClpP protease subunit